MVRARGILLLIFPALLIGLAWHSFIGEYFGRGDVVRWARRHPTPPPPPAEPGPFDVSVVATRQVIPGPGLPASLSVAPANNNLDVVRHDGRVYLAWRTARDHFPDSHARIQVISSVDEERWQLELTVSTGTDLREPRLLSFDGHLRLYVSRVSSRPFSFRPLGVVVTERQRDGAWSALTPLGLPRFVVWRTRVQEGKPIMLGYFGGENLYAIAGGTTQVRVLTTEGGHRWRPAYRNDGPFLAGGTETDLARLPDGSFVSVTRNEGGDDDGIGSKICWGALTEPARWVCHQDGRRFDSPLLFEQLGEVYLIARRNVTSSGLYDVAGGGGRLRTLRDELAYITSAKRCSLWHYDRAQNDFRFVLDLPSRGDTCFASVLDTGRPDEVVVYDYSSPVDGPEMSWAAGQRRPTFIYRHLIRFTPVSQREIRPRAAPE
jgi:hypothetical protein